MRRLGLLLTLAAVNAQSSNGTVSPSNATTPELPPPEYNQYLQYFLNDTQIIQLFTGLSVYNATQIGAFNVTQIMHVLPGINSTVATQIMLISQIFSGRLPPSSSKDTTMLTVVVGVSIVALLVNVGVRLFLDDSLQM